MLGAAPSVRGGQLGRSDWRNPRNPQHTQHDPSRPRRGLGSVHMQDAQERAGARCSGLRPGPRVASWAEAVGPPLESHNTRRRTPRGHSGAQTLCICKMHRNARGLNARGCAQGPGWPAGQKRLVAHSKATTPSIRAFLCIWHMHRVWARWGLEGSCCACCGFRGFRQTLLPSWPPGTLGAAPSIKPPRVLVHLAYAHSQGTAGASRGPPARVVGFEWVANRFCQAGHPGPWAQPRALSPRAFLCIWHMHRV